MATLVHAGKAYQMVSLRRRGQMAQIPHVNHIVAISVFAAQANLDGGGMEQECHETDQLHIEVTEQQHLYFAI